MHCDMTRECSRRVTHIGEKGYIYCSQHAIERRQYVGERTRRMRAWEVKLIECGLPLPTYKRLPKPKPVLPERIITPQDIEQTAREVSAKMKGARR